MVMPLFAIFNCSVFLASINKVGQNLRKIKAKAGITFLGDGTTPNF
jgi:hypothetical protein